MPYTTLEIEVHEGLAVMTLNRPDKMNAINTLMNREIEDALTELRGAQIRALVLTGRGRGFCSGADVSAQGGPAALLGSTLERLREPVGWPMVLLHRFEWPTIAAVNGPAVGAGFSLALACDIRLCSDDARFSAMYVKRGLMPDCGCTWLLPRVIGCSRALELMYSGRMVLAPEAERIGLVSRVTPNGKVLDEAMALASQLAQGPPFALKAIKIATFQGLGRSLEDQVAPEAYVASLLIETEDHKEGVQAFLEKREPRFKGR